MTPAERLVTAARGYLGVPFFHLGRTRAGLDCVGLLLVAAADAGIKVDDPGRYERFHRSRAMQNWLAERLDRMLPLSDAAPGDVLLFSSHDTHLPCHVGLMAERDALPSVIHAHAQRGRVLEERLAWHLKSDLLAAYRIREG